MIVNQKPYRYPTLVYHLAKLKPFLIPVVLVKKKDHSWRMCVDCKRLNNLNIKDLLSIPLVDKLR